MPANGSTGRLRAPGSHRLSRRRASVLSTVVALLASLGIVNAGLLALAPAANAVDVQGFEIDGNVTDDATSGKDWETPTGQFAPDPVEGADTSNFTLGSKEFEHPNTWVMGTGTAPNQDDISGVYTHNETIDGDVWAFFGFRRLTTSGTTNYDVEYNQLPNAASDPAEPNRSVGDLMLKFEQEGNSAFRLTFAFEWTLMSDPDWSEDEWIVDGKKFGPTCIQVPGYSPAAGWCHLDVAAAGFVGATGEDGHFAEGALNLSSFFADDNDCRPGFGTGNIRSFTGNANESALKDYVEPLGINVPGTCGKLVIKKVDQFGTLVPGATFSISPNPRPGDNAPPPISVTDGGAGDVPQVADGIITIDPATPGDYTVTETQAPPGYELPPLAQRTFQVTVAPGGNPVATVTVTDRRYFKPLQIANQVTAKFDVEYDWKVEKSVDKHRAEVPEGTPATFTYSVKLTALSATRDYADVTGKLTITNADTLPMTATISNSLTGNIDCTFPGVADVDAGTAGLQVTVAPGPHDYAYTCATGDSPAASGTSTGTVSWDPATYPQEGANPSYTRTAPADYTYTVAQSTDEQVTVTDVFDGQQPGKDLGTFTWDDFVGQATPPVTKTIATYERQVPGVPGECRNYTNKVTADENDTTDSSDDSETVTVCVGKDLTIDKIATLAWERMYNWEIVKSGPTTVFTGEDENGDYKAEVTYQVDLTAKDFTDSGHVLGGEIYLSNPNDWDVVVTIEDVATVDGTPYTCTVTADDVDANAAGHQISVPADASAKPYAYTCPGVKQGPYVGTNKATITWDKQKYFTPSDSATKTVDIVLKPDTTPANYDVTLKDVLDGAEVPLPQSSFNWDVVHAKTSSTGKSHTQTLTYTRTLSTTAGKCQTHDNTVTITQTGQSDPHRVEVCAPGVEKTYDASYGRKRLWTVTKDVDKTHVEIAQDGTATFTYTVKAVPGDVVDQAASASWTGMIKVSNPSASESLTVDVTDIPGVQGWTCQFTATQSATQADVVIAPGTTKELAYSCTGSGHPDGDNTAQVTFGDHEVSTTVPITFTATEEILDSKVTIRDDKTNQDLPPGFLFEADYADLSTWSHTYQLVKTGVAGVCTDYTNTATLDLTASPDPAPAGRTVTVCVEKPLTLSKTVAADLERSYQWSIDKVADATRRDVDSSGTAKFHYTVTVKAGQSVDSGWAMKGTITVTNPNEYAAGDITASITDTPVNVGGGVVCTVQGGQEVVIPAKVGDRTGVVTLPYTCSFTGAPSNGTNVASASWTPPGAGSPATASTAPAPVAFTVRAEHDKVVDVVDDKTVPGQRVVLQEDLVWAPGLTKSYEYDLAVAGGAPGACRDHTNTAIVDMAGSNDPSDQATVTACTPPPPPPAPPEPPVVAGEQGKAVGSLGATCQGTVRARLRNTFSTAVVYKVKIGTKSYSVRVKPESRKIWEGHGAPRARAVLKFGADVLDRVRVPKACEPPEVLPETGKRPASRTSWMAFVEAQLD